MRKKFWTFLFLGVFWLSVSSVDAAVFEYGDAKYVLDEISTACYGTGENALTQDDIYSWGLPDGSVIANSAEGFVKITPDGKCEEVTPKDMLDMYSQYDTFVDFSIEKNDAGDYDVKKITERGYLYYLALDEDSEIVEGNEYYTCELDTVTDPTYPELNCTLVENPDETTPELYYQGIVLTFPSKVEYMEGVTYYQLVDARYEEVEKLTFDENYQYIEANAYNYLVEVPAGEEYKEEIVLTLSNDVFGEILENEGLMHVYPMTDYNNNILFIEVTYYIENEISEEIYDLKGNLVIATDEFDFNYVYALSEDLFSIFTDEGVYIYGYDGTKLTKIYEEAGNTLPFLQYYAKGNSLSLITQNAENIVKLYNLKAYELDKQSATSYDGKDIQFTFSGDANLLSKVLLNGTEVAKENYTVVSGSTIITLKNDYLKTLKAGTYTLTVEYSDGGSSAAQFTMTQEAIDNANTSDDVVLYAILGVGSMLALASASVYLKKQN